MIEDRIKRYWTRRAHDFSTVRKNELKNHLRVAWLQELVLTFPPPLPSVHWTSGQVADFFPYCWQKREFRWKVLT